MRHVRFFTPLAAATGLALLLSYAGNGVATRTAPTGAPLIAAANAATAVAVPTASTAGTPTPGPTQTVMASGSGAGATAALWAGLPTRTRVKSGTLGDPVNIAFEGTQSQITAAFQKIGWVEADPLSLHNDVRLARAFLAHRSYPTAPVSNLYLFNRPEDIAVEHELGSVSKRHHARFWDTGRQDAGTHKELWIGDCSQDTNVEPLRKHGIIVGTTHHIDPNLDRERDYIFGLMKGAGLISGLVIEPGMGRTTNGRNAGGDPFSTDGRVDLIILK